MEEGNSKWRKETVKGGRNQSMEKGNSNWWKETVIGVRKQ